ncbi:hypothetical protein [Nannocystis sp. SCPEA4]|uniref:hypothetical protein n=1 Tax=Nannocystis sp. SCPEA4 TaxID=2996787 RepID=UPI00226E3897|nr:hypothetical protein [Nannocystis sp. SCPEA4]MCY1062693.1 hypothetical protein [Nannocystis sp. SCPEA4]
MTTTRALILPGKTPRIWKAELDGGRLTITSGTMKKPATKEETFERPHEAEEKYVAELLKKLRGGYVLDGAQEGLVAQFLVSDENGASSVSPDGETVWDVENRGLVPTAKVYARSGELLATHDLRALGIPQDIVSDVVALSRDAALIACASTEVWKLDASGLRVFARAEGCTGRLRVGGDRVLLRGHRNLATLFDLDGNVIVTLENVQHCALGDDGRYLATCAEGAGELIVWDAKDGTEVRRCSFGAGRGVHDLAINGEHVAGLSIYFPGSGRRSIQAFSIATGEPALTKLFADTRSVGGVEAFTTTGFVVGSGSFYAGDDDTPVQENVELSRLASWRSAHVASGGRFVLERLTKGVVAVWDTTQLPREAPKVEPPPKPKLPAPGTDWVVPKTPAPQVTDDALVIPFENEPVGTRVVPGGIIYSSYVDDVSTFVDLTSWPPRTSSRMVVFGAARSPSGMFALEHRDGLWLTRDFSERGEHLPTPRYADVVGFLGEAPMLFDLDGQVAPLIWQGGAWKEVTGLHAIDATGGTGAHNLSDGVGFITFRDAAWHVDAQARATKLFDMTGVNPSWTFPTIDGRVVCPLPAGKLVFYSRDGRKSVVDVTEKKKVSLGVQPMPGPNRSLLVTFNGTLGRNKTEFIGAQVPLSGGKPTLLTRADFGITADCVAELFMCGDEVLAHVEGPVFHRLKKRS